MHLRAALRRGRPGGRNECPLALHGVERWRPVAIAVALFGSHRARRQQHGGLAAIFRPFDQAVPAVAVERGERLGKHVRRILDSDWNRALAGKRVKIHAIGFYFESPDVGAFLWALARENDGSFVGMSKP